MKTQHAHTIKDCYELPAVLREAMKSRDLKQGDLARMLSMSQSQVSLIVNGNRIPSLPTLVRICRALNITIHITG